MSFFRFLALGIVAVVVVYLLIQNSSSGGVFSTSELGSTAKSTIDITEEWRGGRIVNASIPVEDIRSGGPSKDVIPSLTNPRFVSVEEAQVEGLADDVFGLSVEAGAEVRFYPYSILVWHEIVNDIVGGKPILVTYCPLCFTGIVFDREVSVDGDDQILEFGVSGLLYNNNLLMYNRVLESDDPPETLWSQARGEAVAGPITGTKLMLWPTAETVEWKSWSRANPNGKVLSQETGYRRDYTNDPYFGYFDKDNSRLKFPLSYDDDRLVRKEVVEGVVINGEAKAYVREGLILRAPVEDVVGGVNVVWEVSNEGATQLFNRDTGERIGAAESFWFSWVATYPETKLWP